MESAYANVVYVLWDNYPYAIRERRKASQATYPLPMVIMKSL